jgi:hypothetical protein
MMTSPNPIRFMRFAPVVPPRGAMFGAAHRVARDINREPVVNEDELSRIKQSVVEARPNRVVTFSPGAC